MRKNNPGFHLDTIIMFAQNKKLNIEIPRLHVHLFKQKNNNMVIFIKKIKTKEGINTFDVDKIKKDIPAGYKTLDSTPSINYTANHVVVSFKCQKVENKTKNKKAGLAKKKAASK